MRPEAMLRPLLPVQVLLAVVVLGLGLLGGAQVQATSIDVYEFESPEQEDRFHALNAELRCPKCLNTNLWGSDAPIARDLRRTVADMIREGHSDGSIRDYLVSRYGDFILYNPRFTWKTAILWVGPFALLFLGFVIIGVMIRNQRRDARTGAASLTPDDEAKLARLRSQLETDTSGVAPRS